MKIAVVRGDYLSAWEMPIYEAWLKNHEVTIFTGKFPVYKINFAPGFKVEKLWSPADLNFGKVKRWKMAILNRIFVDAHVLFGLEEKLRGFDVAYVSETFYGFTHQCLEAKKKGYLKSVVSHASENTPFNNESIWGKGAWKQQAMREMEKFVAITAGAEKVLLQEGCDSEKIVRLYPGIDRRIFKPLSVVDFRGVKKNDRVKLLFVGRLVPEKGILEILKMFTQLSKNFPKLELVVADRGPLASVVEEYAAAHKNVYYLGRIDPYQDMAKLYSLCDIYLHFSVGSPTWVEQYGFNLLEAMACGLPVMGLDKGSVKEVVRNGGRVVGKREYLPTLEKLIRSVTLRKTISRQALELVQSEYDAKIHANDLEKLFKSTL